MAQERGFDLLRDPSQNKGTAFSRAERERHGLQGLLPYQQTNQTLQLERTLENLRRKAFDIEKYIFLNALQDRNERLYYRLIRDHIEEIMPLIYTPTVGQACKEFAHIYRQAKGFYITPDDRGKIKENLANWPNTDVRMIVVTDGERILGLGDLGANGMGIPIGKLALYTAAAGIKPEQCLPVMLDVGTNNQELLDDPLYLGYPHKRLTGEAYDALADEFVTAVQEKYPDALIQFEDFATPNAYKLLNRYRDQVLCFNDDIQGTASVVLAGVLSAARVSGIDITEQKIMFLGAGSAATGIADLITAYLQRAGLSREEALSRLWFVDVKGLVVAGRDDLMAHNLPYAHEHPAMDFTQAVDTIKPTTLIGATGVPGVFTEAIIRKMAALNDRPAIFALSNPTSRAECTAEQAFAWTDGRAIFASGSPFEPITYGGRTYRIPQGNNAYIFPGVGLGAIAAKAKLVTDAMMMTAAEALASFVSEADLADGAVYPRLTEITAVSLEIALAVARTAASEGLAASPLDDDDEAAKASLRAMTYNPRY